MNLSQFGTNIKLGMIKVTRRSLFTGKETTMDLPITEDQIKAYESGALIQHAFPNLNADQREFILTGTTPDEWADAFGEDGEDWSQD